MDKTPNKSLKRKKSVDKTMETTPTFTKFVFPQFCNVQIKNVTFDDIAGCDSVLLV